MFEESHPLQTILIFDSLSERVETRLARITKNQDILQ
jgi:hypothetical protein